MGRLPAGMGATYRAGSAGDRAAVQRGLLLDWAGGRLAGCSWLVTTASSESASPLVQSGIRLGRPVGLLVRRAIVTDCLP